VSRWRQKAVEAENPFDRFFSSWIALIIAARGDLSLQQLSRPDTDRKAVIQYLESRAGAVEDALGACQDDTAWLAKREGTSTGGRIVDVYEASPQHLRETFDVLAAVWAGQMTRKARWVANATAELLNHVRNHMFHGVKNPDDAADQELVTHLNQVLIRLLQ
jgi:hypothetical protein